MDDPLEFPQPRNLSRSGLEILPPLLNALMPSPSGNFDGLYTEHCLGIRNSAAAETFPNSLHMHGDFLGNSPTRGNTATSTIANPSSSGILPTYPLVPFSSAPSVSFHYNSAAGMPYTGPFPQDPLSSFNDVSTESDPLQTGLINDWDNASSNTFGNSAHLDIAFLAGFESPFRNVFGSSTLLEENRFTDGNNFFHLAVNESPELQTTSTAAFDYPFERPLGNCILTKTNVVTDFNNSSAFVLGNDVLAPTSPFPFNNAMTSPYENPVVPFSFGNISPTLHEPPYKVSTLYQQDPEQFIHEHPPDHPPKIPDSKGGWKCQLPCKRTQYKYKPEEWDLVVPKIKKLKDEGIQDRLVAEILSCIYRFQISKSMLKNKKRFPKSSKLKNKQRISKRDTSRQEPPMSAITNSTYVRNSIKRANYTPEPPKPDINAPIESIEEFLFKSESKVRLPESLTMYPHQEQVLVAVDRYVRSILDPGSARAWTVSLTGLDPPEGSVSEADMWQLLSDQCYGASRLVQENRPGKAEITLRQFFIGLKQAAQNPRDPWFLIKIWRICLYLRSIDSRAPQLQALNRFFSGLLESLPKRHGEYWPTILLVESLSKVEPIDFKDTLRIGYYKAILTMEGLIGDETVTTLHMRSVYYKYWDKQYLHPATFVRKFQHLWGKTHDKHCLLDPRNLAVEYNYTYAVTYVCGEEVKRVMAEKMAQSLLERVLGSLGDTDSPDWSFVMQAFSFASRIVADFHRERGVLDGYRYYMENAIKKLQKGDRECQTRAAQLSHTLAKWLKKWTKEEEAQREMQRTELILSNILGVEMACRRHRKRRRVKRAERIGVLNHGRKEGLEF